MIRNHSRISNPLIAIRLFLLYSESAFAGGGINWAGGNQEINDIAATLENLNDYNLEYLWQGKKVRPYGRAGIDLEFKVSKAVSIMLEGNANMISDKYNSKKADNPDWYFNALAGVRINLGKSYTKKAKPVEEPAPAPAPEQEYVAPKPEPKPAPVEKKVEEIRRDIPYAYSWKKEHNLPGHYGPYDKDLEELFRRASEIDNIVLNYLREVERAMQYPPKAFWPCRGFPDSIDPQKCTWT